MDKVQIYTYLNDLKSLPTNEVNIRRLAEATTAIKNFSMLSPEMKPEVIRELEESETLFNAYMRAKEKYASERNGDNLNNLQAKLKALLMNMHDTISDIWSLCDTETEKAVIKDYVQMYCEKVK